MDRKGLNPKTLWESNAYQHAMTPAAKIGELGNVGAAQEWARREAVGFVEANLSEASRLYKQASQTRNGLEASFNAFGAAMHPVMDNASPTHTGFQIYDGSKMYPGVVSPTLPLVEYAIEMNEHTEGESRKPTEAEMNVMIDEMRLRFYEVYGEELLSKSDTTRRA